MNLAVLPAADLDKEREAVRQVAKAVNNRATVAALCRTKTQDLDRAGEAQSRRLSRSHQRARVWRQPEGRRGSRQ